MTVYNVLIGLNTKGGARLVFDGNVIGRSGRSYYEAVVHGSDVHVAGGWLFQLVEGGHASGRIENYVLATG